MRRSVFPANADTINIVDVSSVDDYLTKIAPHGGTVVRSKMAIPGIGYASYCQDTEGNLLGVFQEDPTPN